MPTTDGKYQSLVQHIRTKFPDWECVALFNQDGEMIAAAESSYNLEAVGVVSSSNFKILEENLQQLYQTKLRPMMVHSTEESGQNNLRQLMIRSKEGILILNSISHDMILVIFTKNTNNLNEILPEISHITSMLTDQTTLADQTKLADQTTTGI